MTLTRKDGLAAGLTLLVVLTFVTTYQDWDVPLIGDSHRVAAVVIALLGTVTCALGSPGQDRATTLLMCLGATALLLTLLALVFPSVTMLALLVADIVVLWVASTLRHAHVLHAPGRPLTR